MTQDATYQDPVEIVWCSTVREIGWRLERSQTVFASYDGASLLQIGVPATLDPDDSLAQLVLHEICHALVEGPESLHLVDFGLDSENPSHALREHACLRVQAALCDRHGLRGMFAPTTEYRAFYDALPADPVGSAQGEEGRLARAGFERGRKGTWAGPLERALAATARFAMIVRPFAEEPSIWRRVTSLALDGQHEAPGTGC